ncbi:MAG: AmmeMemoRadiSam system protein B [Candidatus Omnitrophota bacterium]
MNRKPMWAGPQKFYPEDPDILKKYFKKVIDKTAAKQEVKAVMLPHAGYFYSGAVAGKTISCVKVPDTIILLGPNHTGLGQPYSLVRKGLWSTPLGEIKICSKLADLILENSDLITEDETPHTHEHSLEVELPFLKYLNSNISIVPIIISDFFIDRLEAVGDSLARAIVEYAKPVLIVISSDMTHYEPAEQVELKDQRAIDAMLELNPQELFARVNAENISMCGFGPAVIGLFACKKLGAKKARLIDYQTSGDVTEDFSSVVGYAGIIIQ